ncbi:MAG: hypothetical protein HY562_08555 [Ignavibacteriales bacterium]|nr:hypothetical protein [Ignavibacteriales bacterium]
MENNGVYPRVLRRAERELLLWVLPEERPGYREYRDCVKAWKIAAQGRRGTGNYILAPEGTVVDNDSPLPQVFAFGAVITANGEMTITVRERLGDQLEFEITTPDDEQPAENAQGVRRWTFSTWLPSQPCPICSMPVREVAMKTRSGLHPVFAVCPRDQRLWVYDEATGVNHPIPVTNIYNELVMQRKVRDPLVALDSKRLFSDLASYSDEKLTKAFAVYNTVRTKIPMEDMILAEEPKKRSLLKRLFSKA